jgi:hypothetical protein
MFRSCSSFVPFFVAVVSLVSGYCSSCSTYIPTRTHEDMCAHVQWNSAYAFYKCLKVRFLNGTTGTLEHAHVRGNEKSKGERA